MLLCFGSWVACPSKPAAAVLVEVHLRQAFSGHGLQIHRSNWWLQLDAPQLLSWLPLRPALALTPARRERPVPKRPPRARRAVVVTGPKDRGPPRLPAAAATAVSAKSSSGGVGCLHGRGRRGPGPVLHEARAGAASQRPLATPWPPFLGFVVLELVGHSADVIWL